MDVMILLAAELSLLVIAKKKAPSKKLPPFRRAGCLVNSLNSLKKQNKNAHRADLGSMSKVIAEISLHLDYSYSILNHINSQLTDNKLIIDEGTKDHS